MTKTELNKFKKILETKLEELERIVRNRDAITIEKSADALDEVQHAAERELAIRNLDRESNLLRNVRSALHAAGYRFRIHYCFPPDRLPQEAGRPLRARTRGSRPSSR